MGAPDVPDDRIRSHDWCQRAEAARLKAIEKRKQAEAALAWAQIVVRDAVETCRNSRAMSEALNARRAQARNRGG